MAKVKKKIKSIKVDLDKCNGCRACEVACSAFHAKPKYSSKSPYWAQKDYSILVNNKKIRVREKPGSFISITRKWQTGRWRNNSTQIWKTGKSSN